MNKLTVLIAFFLVLVNVIVLAGISYNRSGEVITKLQLTERELSLPYRSYRQKENSGLALRLNWNFMPDELYRNRYSKYGLQRYNSPTWLSEEKLKEMGVDVENTRHQYKNTFNDYGKLHAEDIIIVLEYNGESFQIILSNAEKNIQILRDKVEANPDDSVLVEQLQKDEKSLIELKTSESRLIAIDAGRDLQALKEKYSNSNKYLMMRGELRHYWTDEKLQIRIQQLFISNIHVPLPYSKEIKSITSHETSTNRDMWNGKPRYQLGFNVGKRLEPWIGELSGDADL